MIRKKNAISVLLIFTLVFSIVFSTTSVSEASAYTGKYWLKVNEQQNVITAYKKIDGKWKPVRAMLCSTGLNGATPKGTFYTSGKWNWGELMNDVYGQYCTHITGDILFHSVYYLKPFEKDSQPTGQFNMLGYSASHGCIRLSVMDAKWIYKTCKVGTRVTIYRSSNPGPLGKPAGITVWQGRYTYWDPTDPDPANPYYLLKKPVITISSKKNLNVQYGSKYNLMSYVHAKDPNTFMDLTSRLNVSKVEKYSSAKNAYVKSSFSTEKLGTYRITYKVDDPYSGKASATLKIKVTDNRKAPAITGAKNRTVTWGTYDAVGSVKAKQASCDRTKAIQVYIKAPGAKKFKIHTLEEAKDYKFRKTGKYTVKYRVKNKYSPYKIARKTITITSKKGEINKDPKLTVPENKEILIGTNGAQSGVFEGFSASHNGKDVSKRITVSVRIPGKEKYEPVSSDKLPLYIFDTAGEYKIKYSVKNNFTPYQTVSKTQTVTVADPFAVDTATATR